MKFSAALFALILFAVPALGEERESKNGEAVKVQIDKAYILARTLEMHGHGLHGKVRVAPILIRMLSEEELRHATTSYQKDPKHWKEMENPNVIMMPADEPYSEK